MANDIQVPLKNQAIPNDMEFQILQTISRMAASSGLYQGTESKIIMILLAARELGIQPMQALNGGLWNIQGKIEISARLMNSLIRKAGHSIVIKECNSTKCIMEGKRIDNGDTFTSQFTIEEAQKAKLIQTNRDGSPGIWMKYTEDMLYARAMSRLARRLFPDVIGTCYVEGEIRDSKNNIVIGDIKECEMLSLPEMIENPEEDEIKINQFLSQFDPSKISSMKTFLEKYANHWKKTVSQTLKYYEDKNMFEKDFNKWESKQTKN